MSLLFGRLFRLFFLFYFRTEVKSFSIDFCNVRDIVCGLKILNPAGDISPAKSCDAKHSPELALRRCSCTQNLILKLPTRLSLELSEVLPSCGVVNTLTRHNVNVRSRTSMNRRKRCHSNKHSRDSSLVKEDVK